MPQVILETNDLFKNQSDHFGRIEKDFSKKFKFPKPSKKSDLLFG